MVLQIRSAAVRVFFWLPSFWARFANLRVAQPCGTVRRTPRRESEFCENSAGPNDLSLQLLGMDIKTVQPNLYGARGSGLPRVKLHGKQRYSVPVFQFTSAGRLANVRSLDSARLAWVLSMELSCPISGDQCITAGEHGRHLIPLMNLWQISHGSIKHDRLSVSRYIQRAMALGVGIVENLGFTLQDCCSVFVNDLAWLLGRKGEREIRAMSIGDQSSSVGRPLLRRANGSLQIVEDLKLDDSTRLKEIEHEISVLVRDVRKQILGNQSS
jgi:hypothetical protein